MADTNFDNKIPTNEQVAELFDIDVQSDSSDVGSRVPTNEQLKALMDSTGGVTVEEVEPTAPNTFPQRIETYDLIILCGNMQYGGCGLFSEIISSGRLNSNTLAGYMGDDSYLISWNKIASEYRFNINGNGLISSLFGIKF